MEVFIEKVRNNPCLWNMNHVSFRDVTRKDVTWELVARETGMANGKEAKFQWKKLRDSHREAMRRRKACPVQTLLPWKFEQEMEFLLPNTVKRECITSFAYDMNNTQDSNPDNNTDASMNNSTLEFAPEQSPDPEVPLLNPMEPVNRMTKLKYYGMYDDRDAFRRQVDPNNPPPDALSNLFTSLCQKTRDLPKYLQLRVQREIFDVVSRAEEEALSFESE